MGCRTIHLKESNIFWPLVLFPFTVEHAHTRSYTGRCWVKDIKASFGLATILLTDTHLTCRYRPFQWLLLDLPLCNIEEVEKMEGKPGLIRITFRSATFGKLAKFAISGQPPGSKNQVMLNAADEQRWMTQLQLRIAP